MDCVLGVFCIAKIPTSSGSYWTNMIQDRSLGKSLLAASNVNNYSLAQLLEH